MFYLGDCACKAWLASSALCWEENSLQIAAMTALTPLLQASAMLSCFYENMDLQASHFSFSHTTSWHFVLLSEFL